ncbi:hypothetical protein QYM36_015185 [Artemia franciscana]|uniref:Reverse transcriptase n=1 Tax=Artemia franciscana TaxID=6661 RepID=A0AA88HL14_ARTSF|nr:hypothetical protein QYM36_015185 [Artemia franciscana]
MNEAEHKTAIKQEVDVVSKYPECYMCGGQYSHGHKRPAKGKICSKCGKINHFARVCKSKTVHQLGIAGTSSGSQAIHALDFSPCLGSELYIDSMNQTKYHHNDLYFSTQKKYISFKLDTGADANILPLKEYERCCPRPILNKTNSILTSYTNGKLNVYGVCEAEIQYKDRPGQKHKFFMVDTQKVPIISRQTSVDLGLVKFIFDAKTMQPCPDRIKIMIDQYADVFEGIGQLPGMCKLTLKEGAVPTVQLPKRVPFGFEKRLKAELDRLEQMKIIEKVTKPTDWVNSVAIVEKANGNLRICLDPVDLNKNLKRPHYLIPTFESITQRCAGAKIFSKLDATSGFWSMMLDDESSDLTTFNTIYGCYKFKRYPFGLNSAQDDFQRKMEEAFENLNLGLIVDDIVICGADDSEHDERLKAALEPAREKNAITEMPPPENSKQLQKLLDMLNYLSRYIPNLSSLNKSLRELARADEYKWKPAHEKAFSKVKSVLCSNLAYFDPKCKNIEIKVDASKHGLGTVLAVDNNVVAFGSCSMSETKQQYSQIEKELLAVVFGCKYFHQYIYGRTVTITTDHKPLESILVKPISKAPPRLQRMMLSIQPYMPYLLFEFNKQKKQGIQKSYHDQTAKSLTALKEGQPVWVKLSDKKRWERALLVKVFGDAPHSYLVKTQNGSTYQRNQQHIRPQMSPNDDPLGTKKDNTLHPSPRPISNGTSFEAGNVSPFGTTPLPRVLLDPSSPEQALTSPLALRTPGPIAVPPQSNEDVSTQMLRDTRHTTCSGWLVKPVIPLDL